MRKYKVQMITLDEKYDFIHITGNAKCHMDLVRGNVTVDAASMLGVTAINTMNECVLEIHSDDENEIAEVVSKLQKFIKGEVK